MLLVDDEDVPRDVVREYLLAEDHHVIAAATAQEGFDRFHTHDFETDHAMAGMNGAQLAGSMKAAQPKQPILMRTAFTDPSLSADETPQRVDLRIKKSIPQKELREAVAQLCPS